MNIDMTLQEAPSIKATRAEEAENLRLEYARCKEALRHLEAMILLKTKATNPKMTAIELKATVDTNDEVYEARLECIKMESAYKVREIRVQSADDAFTSAKVQARLKISEMSSLRDTVK